MRNGEVRRCVSVVRTSLIAKTEASFRRCGFSIKAYSTRQGRFYAKAMSAGWRAGIAHCARRRGLPTIATKSRSRFSSVLALTTGLAWPVKAHCRTGKGHSVLLYRVSQTGREDPFDGGESCHSSTPIREWQQVNRQPTRRYLSQNDCNGQQLASRVSARMTVPVCDLPHPSH